MTNRHKYIEIVYRILVLSLLLGNPNLEVISDSKDHYGLPADMRKAYR